MNWILETQFLSLRIRLASRYNFEQTQRKQTIKRKKEWEWETCWRFLSDCVVLTFNVKTCHSLLESKTWTTFSIFISTSFLNLLKLALCNSFLLILIRIYQFLFLFLSRSKMNLLFQNSILWFSSFLNILFVSFLNYKRLSSLAVLL